MDVERLFLRVFEIFIPHLQRHYLLDGSVAVQMRLLCVATNGEGSSIAAFTGWLNKFELSHCVYSRNIQILYSQYHGAHLLRLYLRRLLVSSDDTAVTGSYVLKTFLESCERVPCSWRPSDLDIFVTSLSWFERVQELYEECVLQPLRLHGRIYRSKCYHRLKEATSSDAREESDLEVSQAVDSDPAPLPRRSVSSDFFSAKLRSRSEIVACIKEWSYVYASPCIRCAVGNSDACICEETRQTWQNLPVVFSTDYLYRLRETVKIEAYVADGSQTIMPDCLLPLNVILVEMPPHPVTTNLMHILMNGFDILNCATFLEVHDDLSYDVLSTPEVVYENRLRRLRLSPYAFDGGSGSIHRSMSRIQTYLERGFHW